MWIIDAIMQEEGSKLQQSRYEFSQTVSGNENATK